jgi:hypothetical protein
MGTATTATTAAMASSTSAMSGMSGHDHGGMDMGGSCKISVSSPSLVYNHAKRATWLVLSAPCLLRESDLRTLQSVLFPSNGLDNPLI